MFYLFSCFTPKFFYFRLLVYPRAFSTYLLVEFSFVILEYPVLLDAVSICYESPFSCHYLLTCLFKLSDLSAVLFWSFHSTKPLSSHSTFNCCCNFFTSPNRIFRPSFVFLFWFLKGTPILSQTCFHSYINLLVWFSDVASWDICQEFVYFFGLYLHFFFLVLVPDGR